MASSDVRAPDTYRALFATSKGPFVLALHREWAPLAADRLWTLLGNGFYNGARFHRVVNPGVVQFGIAADPELNRRWLSQTLADEPRVASNSRWRVGFATSGEHSRATQLFIHTARNEWLDEMAHQARRTHVLGARAGSHAGCSPSQRLVPFGEVEEGKSVILSLAAAVHVDEGVLAAYGESYTVRARRRTAHMPLRRPRATRTASFARRRRACTRCSIASSLPSPPCRAVPPCQRLDSNSRRTARCCCPPTLCRTATRTPIGPRRPMPSRAQTQASLNSRATTQTRARRCCARRRRAPTPVAARGTSSTVEQAPPARQHRSKHRQCCRAETEICIDD